MLIKLYTYSWYYIVFITNIKDGRQNKGENSLTAISVNATQFKRPTERTNFAEKRPQEMKSGNVVVIWTRGNVGARCKGYHGFKAS